MFIMNCFSNSLKFHVSLNLLSPAFLKTNGGTLFLAFRGAWCVARGAWYVVRCAWFRIFSRYLVPLTPPTVFVRSFWNFTGALGMVWRYACVFLQNPEIIFFFYFLNILNLDIFWVLILQGYREQVPCPLNSSHSFWPILLKLYMGF